MELIIGTAVVVVGGVTWLAAAAERNRRKRQRQKREKYLARRTYTSELQSTSQSAYDQMNRTSDAYLKNVDSTLRR